MYIHTYNRQNRKTIYHTCMDLCVYVCMYTCIYIHTYIYTCMYTIRAWMCAYVYTYMLDKHGMHADTDTVSRLSRRSKTSLSLRLSPRQTQTQ